VTACCDITMILAFSTVVGVPIHTFWPPLNGLLKSEPLTRVLIGRGEEATFKALAIMWSSYGNIPDSGPVECGHQSLCARNQRCKQMSSRFQQKRTTCLLFLACYPLQPVNDPVVSSTEHKTANVLESTEEFRCDYSPHRATLDRS